MRRRRGALWLAVAAFGAVAALGPRAPSLAGQATRPPVLLITIDTLRADALGSYGSPMATPVLDALAARGTRFANLQAHAVLTLPSHTSIFTGLDPSRHGVHDNIGFRAGDELETWAERLGAAGYDTGAFVASFPLDSQFGLAQGFDVYDDYYDANQGTQFRLVERPAPDVVASARAWIRQRTGSWFAWVHVYDPHAPYAPPPGYRDAPSPYLGEVAATDAALGPLLADAASRNAVVIVTSDHGESLGEHGESTHGIFAYEATLHVPLIVDGIPGQRAGTVVPQRVRHIDILPTVLDLLGLPGSGTEGESLLRLLRGGGASGADRPAYFESMTPNLTRNWAPLRGWVQGGLKFIDLPVPELYDLRTDPRELANLADSRGTAMRNLKDRLDEHLAAADPSAGPAIEDPETLRRLRALGYVGSATSASSNRDYGPEDDPKNLIRLDALVMAATAAADSGDAATARRLFTEVVTARPDMIQAQKLLSTVEYEAGDLAAAIDRLETVLEESGDSSLILVHLAFYYREAGRLDEARDALDAADELEPDNVEALNLLATVYGMQGDPAGALRVLDRVLEIDPSNAAAHANRGAALLDQDRSEQAAQSFNTALRYDPRQADAHNGLGFVAARAGDMDGAVRHWQEAIAADPGQFLAMRNLGITLGRLSRFREAIAVLRQYVAAQPGDAEMRQLLEQLERDHGG